MDGLSLEHTYLREIFESIETSILIADDFAIYVDANRAACAHLGRPRAGIVGHHISEFVEGGRAAEVNEQWKSFLRDGVQSGFFGIRLPTGTSQVFRFQARANLLPGLHCAFLTAVPEPAALPPSPKLLTICAWTKRVRVGHHWITLEDYLRSVHGITVSHGICPDVLTSEIWRARGH